MTVPARVRVWHDELGWGVLDSDETPGGCWSFFGTLAVPGYRTARAGDAVMLQWEAFEQDGYPYRAVRWWPVGIEPVEAEITHGPAHRSSLTITWPEGLPPGLP